MTKQSTAWTNAELDRIGATEEIRIASLRTNGSLRKEVIIWMVRIGDEIYIRCVNGRQGAWFRGVQTQHAGRIWAGGVEKDVTFVEVTEPALIDQISDAYLSKYRHYPQWVAPMVVPEVLDATLKLVPR